MLAYGTLAVLQSIWRSMRQPQPKVSHRRLKLLATHLAYKSGETN